MANAKVTMMTKKSQAGDTPDHLIVKRCPKCGAKWVEPRDVPQCTCKKKAPNAE